MIRSAASKVMWVGRATVFLVGLAVILALVFGVATAAFAGNGDPWRLGRNNVATNITRLAGMAGVDGPMVRITNNNDGANDTALEMLVDPAEPPMKVNSSTRVDSLNADLLDGLSAFAFLRNNTYRTQTTAQPGTQLPDGTYSQFKSCDPGDTLLSGGPADIHATTDIVESFPSSTTTWTVRVQRNGVDDNFVVVVLCANQ